jgi:NADH-quinone oxidoreductase subunit H
MIKPILYNNDFIFIIFFNNILNFLNILVLILCLIIPLILAIAFFTLMERKIIGAMQLRLGPNYVGFFGLLQPIVDGVKLLFKETIIPYRAEKFLFLFAPYFLFALSLITWLVIPLNNSVVISDINLGVLFIFAISSLNVYSIILAGWSSNSNYSLLGALRSAAQMISYEVSIGLILLSLLVSVGSLNLNEIIIAQQEGEWFIFFYFPAFILFFISALAETNRAPFDLPEAEAELVSGYNVEYSAMSFALFFLAEYSNMILMSFFTVILFLGGPLPLYSFDFIGLSYTLKVFFIMFLFVWTRATLPRLRYDQLMMMGWKYILPIALGVFFLSTSLLFFTDSVI